MKMKLNALSLAVAAGFIGSAAQAADVAMFPYVVNSATVTTIVSVVDLGTAATQRYNAAGVVGAVAAGSNRLHWRLNYKADAAAVDNTARCAEVNYYLPSSPNDIQSVDLGGRFGSTTKGVLFGDASINNTWNANTTASINYMLGKAAGAAQRGVLFVHNADIALGQTLYGEAMVLDFNSGASWGYQAALNDSGAAPEAVANFDFSPSATNVLPAPDILTFMPFAETTTRLFVTPVNDPLAPALQPSMLAVGGASTPGWDRFNTGLSLVTGTGVAFDRDENLVSGSNRVQVSCVGAVDAADMMTAGARNVLKDGGHGTLNFAAGNLNAAVAAAYAPTVNAIVTKLEFNNSGKFNGETITGTFNNGFTMR